MRPAATLARILAAVPAALAATSSNIAIAQAARPSFDCAKARTRDEVAICSDRPLAELDRAVAAAVAGVAPIYVHSARAIAKDALAARHACGTDRLCILDQQLAAISALSDFGSRVAIPPWAGSYRLRLFRARSAAPAPDLPHQVGQCALTRIASISTRFGGALKPPADKLDSSGTAVSYTNNGYQVSYRFVGPIAASRVGDGVLLCLVSLPRDCPPGDQRGKVYAGTNLRTKGSWVLPDATHLCGGA